MRMKPANSEDSTKAGATTNYTKREQLSAEPESLSASGRIALAAGVEVEAADRIFQIRHVQVKEYPRPSRAYEIVLKVYPVKPPTKPEDELPVEKAPSIPIEQIEDEEARRKFSLVLPIINAPRGHKKDLAESIANSHGYV